VEAYANFFLNGATARGWIGTGPDGAFGTGDDLLVATGETLPQVQDRVLGVGVASAPLITEVRGFATIGLRGGMRSGRQDLIVDAENLTDESYRGVSWDVDAPGLGIALRYVVRF
jgi:hypothetical protein